MPLLRAILRAALLRWLSPVRVITKDSVNTGETDVDLGTMGTQRGDSGAIRGHGGRDAWAHNSPRRAVATSYVGVFFSLGRPGNSAEGHMYPPLTCATMTSCG